MKVSEVGAQVKALQQQGIEVRFFHYRQVSAVSDEGPWMLRRHYRNGKENNGKRPAHISPVGGATYCLLTTPQGEKFCGVAVFERSRHHLAFPPRYSQLTEVEPRQFCYTLGRAVALGRAVQKMESEMAESDYSLLGDATALLTMMFSEDEVGDIAREAVKEA